MTWVNEPELASAGTNPRPHHLALDLARNLALARAFASFASLPKIVIFRNFSEILKMLKAQAPVPQALTKTNFRNFQFSPLAFFGVFSGLNLSNHPIKIC